MQLTKIYNFRYFKNQKDEEQVHQKITKIAEDARRLGAVIQLKTHFREWMALHENIKDENPFVEKVSNG